MPDALAQPVTTDLRGFLAIIGVVLLALALAIYAAAAAAGRASELRELRDRVARLEGRADRHTDTR